MLGPNIIQKTDRPIVDLRAKGTPSWWRETKRNIKIHWGTNSQSPFWAQLHLAYKAWILGPGLGPSFCEATLFWATPSGEPRRGTRTARATPWRRSWRGTATPRAWQRRRRCAQDPQNSLHVFLIGGGVLVINGGGSHLSGGGVR